MNGAFNLKYNIIKYVSKERLLGTNFSVEECFSDGYDWGRLSRVKTVFLENMMENRKIKTLITQIMKKLTDMDTLIIKDYLINSINTKRIKAIKKLLQEEYPRTILRHEVIEKPNTELENKIEKEFSLENSGKGFKINIEQTIRVEDYLGKSNLLNTRKPKTIRNWKEIMVVTKRQEDLFYIFRLFSILRKDKKKLMWNNLGLNFLD
eukprot:snap_masked-scaffold_10-processed-gene-7.17-mRNA-1 protein AED:1.00 eAED:1.00 QI:0/-1/0/0/-1/1/1/0/206